MALEEPANDARKGPIADRPIEPLRHFGQRQVRGLGDPGKDQISMRVDPMRPLIAAALIRLQIASLARASHKADSRRDADAETRSRRAARRASLHSINNATTQINRKGFGHAGWPPSPANMLNQKP
jgi:hypothetical protein